MNNTALSASVQLTQMRSIKTTHMVFRNRQHENFNYEKSEQAKLDRWITSIYNLHYI